MIKIQNLNKYYGDVQILKNVDMEISKGEIFGIIGHSGAGKSTLLRCINGLEDYRDGSLTVEGQEVKDLTEKEIRELRKNLGMIFQHFSLLERKTVFENVALPLECFKYSKAEIEKRVMNLLELVGLADKRDAKPRNLSGGMNQRVAIALSIMLEPKILLADEPTSALDVTVQAQVVKELLKLRQKLNTSIILVTHNIGVASYMSDNIGVMYGGRIIEYGESEELINNPKHPYTKMLINSVPVINGNIPNGIEGSLPNFQDIKEGCVFLDRCKYASRECKIKVPSAKYWGKSHWSSCLIENEEIAL